MADCGIDHTQLPIDFDSMDLKAFMMWSEPALKSFLSIRNKNTEGDFKTLAARAFNAFEENIPVDANKEDQQRRLLQFYKEKLVLPSRFHSTCSGILPDPFSLKEGWLGESEGMKYWPPVNIRGIARYLNLKCSTELVDRLMNEYKEGKAYRYFTCGWAQEILLHKTSDSLPVCLLLSKVTPSQRLSSKPHVAWPALQKSNSSKPGGEVISAYCTCTAGLHGTCNHVAAMLFRLEAAFRTGVSQVSKTSLPSQWNVRSSAPNVQAKMVKDVKWAKTHLRKSEHVRPMVSASRALFSPHSSKSQEKFGSISSSQSILIDTFGELLPNSAFMKMVNKRPSGSRLKKRTLSSSLPPSPEELASSYPYDSTKNLAEQVTDFVGNLFLNEEQCSQIEEATRGQDIADDGVWMRQRAGRLTASNFHKIKTRMDTVRKSDAVQDVSPTVASVLCYNSAPNTAAIKYGRSSEVFAKIRLVQLLKKDHQQLKVEENPGLHVSMEMPFIGASPDLLFSCSCHGPCLVEIKCPYSIRSTVPSANNVKYLQKDADSTFLKKSHTYYSQIQGQYFCTGAEYGYLFVYTSHGEVLVTVGRDDSAISELIQNLKDFYLEYIVLELLTKSIKRKLELIKASSVSAEPTPSSSSTAPDTGIHAVANSRKVKTKSHYRNVYLCGICTNVCIDQPKTADDNSICCTVC